MVIILSKNSICHHRKSYLAEVAYLSIEHLTRLLIFPKLVLGCHKNQSYSKEVFYIFLPTIYCSIKDTVSLVLFYVLEPYLRNIIW